MYLLYTSTHNVFDFLLSCLVINGFCLQQVIHGGPLPPPPHHIPYSSFSGMSQAQIPVPPPHRPTPSPPPGPSPEVPLCVDSLVQPDLPE